MASIGISESTFAIALLAEQQSRQWGNLSSYPVLPSLFDEAGVGWDAFLPLVGAPMFLQFKISDYMTHWRSAHLAFLQNTPYYRFHLHPRNNFQQHARLRTLSLSYPDTYYVAPEVDTGIAFQNAYLAQTVTEQSRYIPLSACYDIVDGESHEIFYSQTSGMWQASKPRQIDTKYAFQFPRILEHSTERFRPIDRDLASQLIRNLTSIGGLRSREPEAERRASVPEMLRIAADAAMSLGLHLSIVGAKPKN
jgi:hypothetical protein